MSQKEQLKEKFHELYDNKRLLAIQLDGFNHRVFFDNGVKNSKVEIERHTNYAPEQNKWPRATELLSSIPHYEHQNNAVEYIYVLPENR